ncbi:MAG: hypothetical protein Q8L56_12290 [Rhodocyclaceae bacterium]|nr:hypothetical protein [Rhodocyclaceae bacterium]
MSAVLPAPTFYAGPYPARFSIRNIRCNEVIQRGGFGILDGDFDCSFRGGEELGCALLGRESLFYQLPNRAAFRYIAPIV